MNSFSFRLISACFLLITTLLSSIPVHAKDYLIEIVIFETKAGRKLTAGGLLYPNIGESILLNSEAAAKAGFMSIEDGLSLSKNASSMASSGRYQVLRHMAWRQPGLDEESAIAVRINLGDPTTLYLPDDLKSYGEFIPASLTPALEWPRETPSFVVNGTITVRLGRFLHMETLLVFTDPETGQGFRLDQSRKMRSRELHYIDNPRFGILTRILPLDDVLLPETEEADNTGAIVTPE
ncbi:MAG: hypothetical protein ACJAZF_000849 [Granulosicoccus sp.]|jgi:hypothetical protein